MKLEIPGYDIQRQLAEGGMATVYLAVQTSLDRPVALKVLKNTDNPSFSSRFLDEGRTVAALAHPNIVTIYDVGIVGDIHFISMEYVDGGDLEARIRQGLSPAQALDITRQLAACLKFVHQHGIVHRDIKPGNVLFRRNDTPLLTDFGIAKQLQSDSHLTQDGTAIGSPYYLSPEQSKGDKVDARADIYSLGILVFEMLAGHRPFEGKTPIETILKHHKQPLPALTGYVARYNGLIERMAAKSPGQRFADCGAVLAFLDREFPAGASPGPETGSGQTQTLVVDAEQTRSRQTTKRRMARKKAATRKKTNAKTARNPVRGKKKGATPGTRSEHNRRKQSAVVAAVASGALIVSLTVLNRATLFGLDRDDTGNGTGVPVFIWNGEATSHESQLRQLLHKGRQRLQQDRLTTPEGDNAHEYFGQALRLDPKSPAARQGLIDVAERYTVLAEGALQRGHDDKVQTFLERGFSVVPDYPRLSAVQRRLVEKSEAPK